MPPEAIRAHARWIMVAFGLVCLVLLWRVSLGPARPGGHEGPGVPVELAAGQESAMEAIAGHGVALPGCVYAGADVSSQRVIGRYRCSGRDTPVTLELVTGPDERPLTDTTQRFGVIAGEGVPSALRAAVVARLRARENQLQWQPRGGHALGRASLPGATFSWCGAPSLRVLLTQDPSLWLVLAVVFLCAMVTRIARDEARWVRYTLLAVVVVGALLRLVLAVEAPMNAHSFSRVLPLAVAIERGPLLAWLSLATGSTFYFVDVQVWLNFALATLMPLAFFAHARLLLGSGRAALAAAAMMALLPMHIRFSRSDVTFIASLLGSSLTFASLYGSLTDPSRAWRWLYRVALPVFSLATYLTRPENMIFVVLDLGALGLYVRAEVPRRRVGTAALLITLAALWSVFHDLLPHYRQHVEEGLGFATLTRAVGIFVDRRFNTLVNPWMTPPWLSFFAVLGAVTLWREGERRRMAFLLLWLGAFFVVHSYVRPDEVAMQARYHLHLASPFLLLAAAATPRVLAAPLGVRVAVAVWMLLTPLLHRGFIRDVAFTEMREYTFLRALRSHLSPRCTVLEYGPAFDVPAAVFTLSPRTARMSLALRHGAIAETHVRQLGMLPHGASGATAREVYALPHDYTPPPCAYFYQGASCTTHRPAPGRLAAPCEAVHARFTLEPVAEASHTLRPYDTITVGRALRAADGRTLVTRIIHDTPRVQLGLYRITGLRH